MKVCLIVMMMDGVMMSVVRYGLWEQQSSEPQIEKDGGH